MYLVLHERGIACIELINLSFQLHILIASYFHVLANFLVLIFQLPFSLGDVSE